MLRLRKYKIHNMDHKFTLTEIWDKFLISFWTQNATQQINQNFFLKKWSFGKKFKSYMHMHQLHSGMADNVVAITYQVPVPV
jgi:hypothetical protein